MKNDQLLSLLALPDNKLLDKRAELIKEYNKYCDKAKQLEKVLTRIKAELRRRRNQRNIPFISDHAVVRYLERIEGLDVDSIREHIESKIPIDPEIAESNSIVLHDLVLKLSKDHKAVTTVLSKDMLDEGEV